MRASRSGGSERRPSAAPRQNRVAPDGAIEAVAARGLLMGNRGGVLHDGDRRLTARRWVGRRWIACRLSFKGRRRSVMAPRRYTELFFLDEAVAFAAGHRPCAECRRSDFDDVRARWPAAETSADAMDRLLHGCRLVAGTRRQASFRARLAALPAGAMVRLDDRPERAFLVTADAIRPWGHQGYGRPEPRRDQGVAVLTPRPLVAVLERGYAPILHPSAGPDADHRRAIDDRP